MHATSGIARPQVEEWIRVHHGELARCAKEHVCAMTVAVLVGPGDQGSSSSTVGGRVYTPSAKGPPRGIRVCGLNSPPPDVEACVRAVIEKTPPPRTRASFFLTWDDVPE